jgi:hypothetical protein
VRSWTILTWLTLAVEARLALHLTAELHELD